PDQLPLIDPQSGAITSAPIALADSRNPTNAEQRSWPSGYLVLHGMAGVAERLALNNVTRCPTSAPSQLAVAAYDIQRLSPTARAGRESINPDQSVKVTVRPRKIDVPAGALFVPMNQPAAGIVAAALEPDSPGSYVGVGVVPVNDGETEAPVYRVVSEPVDCGGR